MNAQAAPRVSIITPAYNSERYLPMSLRSVLQQTYRDYEMIVVDDGSTDDTRTAVLAADGPIHYIYQPNQGPSAARNTGISAANGEFICFLDADDLWTPDRLTTQIEFMQRHPRIGLVFSDEEEFDENGVRCRSLLATSRYYSEMTAGSVIPHAFQKLLQENFIPTSTVMVRRECFDVTGVFDVKLKVSEDRDMWSRIAAAFPVAYIPGILGRKRIVASSISRDVETTLRSRILLWKKARRLFPHLAPARTVNSLLASTYVQLGFILLHKNKTREARQFGLTSFTVSRHPYEWFLAASLVIFSFTGSSFANSVFRTKRRLLGYPNTSS
jgi:glycosyltransferase involved in cell wall biosynthesis